MIETFVMMATLLVLGYAFYISSRMFWTYKSDRGPWRWVYGLISSFIIATYFLFAVVTFSFIGSFFTSFSLLNILNAVIGIFFLSSSLLIGIIMKHHLSVMRSDAEKRAEARWEIGETSKERLKLQKQIEEMKKEIDEKKVLSKVVVSKELRILELQKRIKDLERYR